MDEFINFLNEHHVMCLATEKDQCPHVAPVFYALEEASLELIFLSDPKTRHMEEAKANSNAAAGIYLETEKIGRIRGAQLWGTITFPKDTDKASQIYYKRFPQARLYHLAHSKHRFGLFGVKQVRFINNNFGIGKNKEWNLK